MPKPPLYRRPRPPGRPGRPRRRPPSPPLPLTPYGLLIQSPASGTDGLANSAPAALAAAIIDLTMPPPPPLLSLAWTGPTHLGRQFALNILVYGSWLPAAFPTLFPAALEPPYAPILPAAASVHGQRFLRTADAALTAVKPDLGIFDPAIRHDLRYGVELWPLPHPAKLNRIESYALLLPKWVRTDLCDYFAARRRFISLHIKADQNVAPFGSGTAFATAI